MKKLCYVATIPAVVHAFLRTHIQAATEHYQVTVVCNSEDRFLLDGINARVIVLNIKRKPSILTDIIVLFQLVKIFRREHFDIVHSIMPKTGMLAMLAARMALVPVRIHTFTGQIWVTKQGLKRVLLMRLDKLIGRLATCLLADSPSQCDFLVSQRVLTQNKVRVIGAGSICGVDTKRFHPDLNCRQVARRELGIDDDAMIILFVGRLNRDKGMLDLSAAFEKIARDRAEVVLLLVGTEEDVSFSQIQNICHAVCDRLHHVSFTAKPEYYMAAADIFCLPSYREGFGMTIIEAAACGVPAVASRIYGITDAIEEGKTGLLFAVGNRAELLEKLLELITNNQLRIQLGNAARQRVLELFSSEMIAGEMIKLYKTLFDNIPEHHQNDDA